MRASKPQSPNPRAFDLRRFSSGERPSSFPRVPVWKFDALMRSGQTSGTETTCYVNLPDKARALQALFERWPGAKVYGTGQPLTGAQVLIETGRALADGEILQVA